MNKVGMSYVRKVKKTDEIVKKQIAENNFHPMYLVMIIFHHLMEDNLLNKGQIEDVKYFESLMP